MPIRYHPKTGSILFCDFSKGFEEPEMVKKRPVIVIAGEIQGRSGLVTVVPLSTVEPTTIQPYHYQVPKQSLPMLDLFQRTDSWVKGDMLYTVGFHRLDLITLKTRDASGKRKYFSNKLGTEQMNRVRECILCGLNLGKLSAFL